MPRYSSTAFRSISISFPAFFFFMSTSSSSWRPIDLIGGDECGASNDDDVDDTGAFLTIGSCWAMRDSRGETLRGRRFANMALLCLPRVDSTPPFVGKSRRASRPRCSVFLAGPADVALVPARSCWDVTDLFPSIASLFVRLGGTRRGSSFAPS